MWAIVETWIPDSEGGFGVVTTESCESMTVRDALVEADVPLRAGDRVWLEYVDAEVVKLVKAQ
ncbi:hypothetical protein [Nocardia sp. NPDC005366]|uniref:hypothetical protein n=1 Tax=Nocardia sp. NPDC005366 TaxID=3156878 RepID=UPI0033B4051A